ncbi:hypothetical protein GLAREA_12548 [Glarea lozoyensis ATCC 20868]|uniref:Tat pathway signal sequence protein n=1 Tax=Glarea lozoyensis (strain ATCC 20868 / MF5171) TaxID=1116229 RepID=S3D075_GLAL2|nr:uncharacterized protein GLAREA_12548 [Glarea lozoyensis ATCC 20868]EPE31245.1 hypothetical protein GLAREA_12548 [Glarea lozoyensis ATCC 20868]
MDPESEKYEEIQFQPLLDEVSDEEANLPPSKSSRCRISWKRFTIFQTLLILVYTTIYYICSSHPNRPQESPAFGFVPAMTSVPQHLKAFAKHGNHHSPYSQPPSESTSQAWSALLSGGNMRISPSELTPYNATSVSLADGTGYLAKTGFYHELHCLYKLKTHLYPEHYYANASRDYMDEEREHLEHCIEWIRTAAICRGDTTLTLFEWVGDRLETKYPIPHMCYVEDELLSWSRKAGRMVDIDEEGILVGPSGNGGSNLRGDG